MPGANVPKKEHGPTVGQSEIDCACVSVIFTIIPPVFYSPYIRSQWDMEVLACFRPGFISWNSQLLQTTQRLTPLHE